MSTQIQSIEKGKVFIFESDALPIYHGSNFFVRNAKVVPDEVNFLSCLTTNGKVAIHVSEDYESIIAKDENGNDVRCIKNEYPYIQATSRSNVKYFLNEESAINHNFKFSFRLGRFHDANDDAFYGSEKLLDYHTHAQRIQKDKLITFVNDADDYLLGLEVEKVDYEKQQDGDAWELLTETGWSKERDGSLGDNGYELVSPILPLFDNSRIKNAMNPVTKWINGKSNDRCGGHITISNRKMNGDDLLESIKDIAPIIYSLYPNRISNTYCKVKSWSKYFSYPEKYSALYLKDGSMLGGRVEIRLFSRVTNQNQLTWRIELIQMLIKGGGNFNQIAQRIACPESAYYKHFAKQYTHEQIGEKLKLMDAYSKQYSTHRNGISPSVKKRINNTMSFDVFSI
jgi:hypothetical protein